MYSKIVKKMKKNSTDNNKGLDKLDYIHVAPIDRTFQASS